MAETSAKVDIEIYLTVPNVLKKDEKNEVLNVLRKELSAVTPLDFGETYYQERHSENLPLLLILSGTTIVANVLTIAEIIKNWDKNQEAGIWVKVEGQSYSLGKCKSAEDVVRIIREIKRK